MITVPTELKSYDKQIELLREFCFLPSLILQSIFSIKCKNFVRPNKGRFMILNLHKNQKI